MAQTFNMRYFIGDVRDKASGPINLYGATKLFVAVPFLLQM